MSTIGQPGVGSYSAYWVAKKIICNGGNEVEMKIKGVSHGWSFVNKLKFIRIELGSKLPVLPISIAFAAPFLNYKIVIHFALILGLRKVFQFNDRLLFLMLNASVQSPTTT